MTDLSEVKRSACMASGVGEICQGGRPDDPAIGDGQTRCSSKSSLSCAFLISSATRWYGGGADGERGRNDRLECVVPSLCDESNHPPAGNTTLRAPLAGIRSAEQYRNIVALLR